jgi:hypothetical protein
MIHQEIYIFLTKKIGHSFGNFSSLGYEFNLHNFHLSSLDGFVCIKQSKLSELLTMC